MTFISNIHIKNDEFLELRDLIYDYSAISIQDAKKYLLENRLSNRIRFLNFSSFKDYIYYLKYDSNKNSEMEVLLNLITINETYFLRELPQMQYLVDIVMPELLAKGKRNIRIWSAACSTGVEPYSLAILFTNAGFYNKAKIDIIGTDINSEVIKAAKKGEYRSMSFRGTPYGFDENFSKAQSIYTLNDDIRQKVTFRTANLISPAMPAIIGKVDVIFCRNVIIYFDQEGKQKVVNMFYNALNQPGYLFLGHSESMYKLSSNYTVTNFGKGLVHVKQ